jgi:hypothetical protein
MQNYREISANGQRHDSFHHPFSRRAALLHAQEKKGLADAEEERWLALKIWEKEEAKTQRGHHDTNENNYQYFILWARI